MLVADYSRRVVLILLQITNVVLGQSQLFVNELLQNHTLIVHYDNLSIVILDELFAIGHDLGHPTVLYNYDQSKSEGLIPRHCCGKFSDEVVNVILLDDKEMFELEFSTIDGNIRSHDILLQVTNNTDGPNGTTWLENIQPLVVNPRSTKQYVYNINKRTTYNITPTIIEVLRFGFITCSPLILRINENGSEASEGEGFLVGPEHVLAQLVAGMMHTKLMVIDYSNCTRPEIVKLVRNEVIDFAGGCMSYSYGRRTIVDFTPNFFGDGYKLYFSKMAIPKHEAFLIALPFTKGSWLLVYLIPLGMGILLVSGYKYFKIKANFNFTLFFPILNEQSINVKHLHSFVKMILAFWVIGAMMFTNAYKSKLSSILIAPPLHEPRNILDTIDRNYEFWVPFPDLSFPLENMNKSINPKIRAVINRWKTNDDFCRTMDVTHYGLNTLLAESLISRYAFWTTCVNNYTPKERDSIRESSEYIFLSGHTWALKFHSRLNRGIVLKLEVLKSHGFINYWYNAYNMSRAIPQGNSVTSHHPEPLDVTLFFSHFVILGVGLLSAVFALIMEVIFCYFKQRLLV